MWRRVKTVKIKLQYNIILVFQILANFFFVFVTYFLDFVDLGIYQGAVPPALEEAPDETFLAFQTTALQEVAVEEIGKGTPEEGEFCITQLGSACT